MASAPALSDICCRYKKGTQQFVQWLAQAARSTGTVEHIFAPVQSIPKGRLKGKARKQAKQAKPGNPMSYEVPIRSIIDLSKAVAQDPNIKIPRAVLTTLSAVIEGRKKCAEWYSNNQDDTDEDMKTRNGTHQYFINILEKTMEILGPKRGHTTHASLPPESIETAETTNMFAALHVEETDQLDDIPDLVTNITDKAPVQYCLEKTDMDVSVALCCFLFD